MPVVDGAPRSSAAERLTTLSETAFGGLAAALSEIIATPRRKPRKLGGLLRRS